MPGFPTFAVGDGTKTFVGRGKLFIDRLVPVTFAKQGAFFAGTCDGYGITPSSELATKRDMTDPSNRLIARVETSRDFEISIDASELRKDMLALHLLGDVGEYTQTATPIVGEALGNSKKDRVFWTAKRKVTAYTVKAAAASKVEGTDYEIDVETGAIYIKPTGSIADASALTIDYTPTAITAGSGLTAITPGTAGMIHAELRFVGDPLNGQIHEALWWRVQMTAAGILALISTDFQNYQLKGTPLALATPPIAGYPYGVVYQR